MAILAVLWWPGVAAAQVVHHPFGSHPIVYAAGAIRPSHLPQASLDQAVRDFYDAWKAQYVGQACGPGRFVVRTDFGPASLTVSEAHGYGMLLAVLMAGHDPQAQQIFDGMYAYFRDHPTARHSYLLSWMQSPACEDINGNESASDGDLDIAYALLLADRQFGSCGAIDYRAEALRVLTDIKSGDLDATARYVLLGDWATPADDQYYPSTRSSDFMPGHFRSFATASGDPAWSGLLESTYGLVETLQATFSPDAGLLPDFVTDPLGQPQPAPPFFLERVNDGAYDFNACRDPWRLATDFLVSGEPRARTAVQRINAFFRQDTGDDPSAIRSGYQLDGSVSAGADYLSMPFVAPLGVGATVDAGNQAWLNAIWDLVAATPIEAADYYGNTLKLLSMITMSGNWWAPQAVGGAVRRGAPGLGGSGRPGAGSDDGGREPICK